MFTVVIADKKHLSAIKEDNALFFESFLKNKEIAFCEWNVSGQTFKESVPDLTSVVGRHELWKAVIINPHSEKIELINPFDVVDTAEIKEQKKKRRRLERMSNLNPYDQDETDVDTDEDAEAAALTDHQLKEEWKKYFNDLYDARVKAYEKASEEPLQRLVTWLCFMPDRFYNYQDKRGLKKSDIHDWLLNQITRCRDSMENYRREAESPDVSPDKKEFANAMLKQLTDEDAELTKELSLLEYDELEFDEFAELKEKYESLVETVDRLEQEINRKTGIFKEELRRRITGHAAEKNEIKTIGIHLPTEVYCIAERTTENSFANPNIAWENHISFDYSDFVERNLYFDKMRFMVFDILPESHKNYRNDNLRFLYAVMIFAENEVPNGALLPRKLYCLSSENDERPLCEIATVYYKKLTETSKQIDKEIDKIRQELPGMFTDTEADAIYCTEKKVDCPFMPDFEEDRLFADVKEYGLFSDRPKSEWTKWKDDYADSCLAFDKLVKQPRRSIKKGVDTLQLVSEADTSEVDRLTPFQIDDVRENTEKSEKEMVESDVPNLYDLTPFRKRMSDRDREVTKVLDRRMKRKTAVIIGIVCLVLFFLCFVPSILHNAAYPKSLTTSLIISAATVGAVGIALVICLICLRKPLIEAVKKFNAEMNSVLSEVKDALGRVGRYLTKAGNVRRGYAVLNYASKHIDSSTRGIRIRKKHQSDIQRQKAYIEEKYEDYIVDDVECDGLLTAPYDYDFNARTEFDYPAPYVDEKPYKTEFLAGGNYVPASNGFAIRLRLTMEEIYDE